jgi:hypothetical protein
VPVPQKPKEFEPPDRWLFLLEKKMSDDAIHNPSAATNEQTENTARDVATGPNTTTNTVETRQESHCFENKNENTVVEDTTGSSMENTGIESIQDMASESVRDTASEGAQDTPRESGQDRASHQPSSQGNQSSSQATSPWPGGCRGGGRDGRH